VYLKGSKKTMYMGHKCWLIRTHKYRKMADSFDGKIEKDSFAPQPATSRTAFEMCQKVCSEHGPICHLFELILVNHANTNGTNHFV
jgi:hypothetical protein